MSGSRPHSDLGFRCNRPALLREEKRKSAVDLRREEPLRHAVQSGRNPAAQDADLAFETIKAGKFCILPHQKIKPAIETRMQDILLECDPTDPMQPQRKS